MYYPISQLPKCRKNDSVSLVVDPETTFDSSIQGMNRKRAKDMSEDISGSGKIPKNYFESC